MLRGAKRSRESLTFVLQNTKTCSYHLRQVAQYAMKRIVQVLLCFFFGTLAVHAAEKPKPPVVITAPAKLETRDKWVYLIVYDAKPNYAFPCAMPHQYN